MRGRKKNQLIRPKPIQQVQQTRQSERREGKFTGKFELDCQAIENILSDEGDLRKHVIRTRGQQRVALYFYPDVINKDFLTKNIIMPLQKFTATLDAELVTQQVISVPETSLADGIQKATDMLSDGCVILVIEAVPIGVLAHIIQVEHRSIERSQSEDNIIGPHSSFSENIAQNIALMHRALATSRLKVHRVEIGSLSRTKVAVMYLDGVAQPDLVQEAVTRLERVDIDWIGGVSYLRDFLEDGPTLLFPLLRITERPQRIAAALTEGRVAVLADGDPTTLILPSFLPEYMQSSEDYREKPAVSSFLRMLRIASAVIGVYLPGLWIALVSFHHGIIPPPLFSSIVRGREQVPLPTIVEAFSLMLAFDIVVEANTRLPSAVGQAIGIVGAIILGQSAVQAQLISPAMTIIVALSGLAVYTQPSPTLLGPLRVLKYLVMIAGSIFGLYGVVWSAIFLTIRTCSLQSFGAPYLFPVAPFNLPGLLDVIVRLPNYKLKHRPPLLAPQNQRRMAEHWKPEPERDEPNGK